MTTTTLLAPDIFSTDEDTFVDFLRSRRTTTEAEVDERTQEHEKALGLVIYRDPTHETHAEHAGAAH